MKLYFISSAFQTLNVPNVENKMIHLKLAEYDLEGKFKGEDLVMDLYSGKIKSYVDHSKEVEWKLSINHIACIAMDSESTVKRIIKKDKNKSLNYGKTREIHSRNI